MLARLLIVFALLAAPIWAVEPDELLDDPVLEARARVLSKGLRCLVCRNESIDDSNADLAKDLRILVRERLVAGDNDEEAIAFIVERYGEYVLLSPTWIGANLVLWLAGPAMLLIGLGTGGVYIRRRRNQTQDLRELSGDEQARLKAILEDGQGSGDI